MTKNDVSYETILLSLEGGIARLTLNRPDKLNSFNVRMHEEVQRALQSVRGQGARVLVLSGAGRGFARARTSRTGPWRRAPKASISATRSSATTSRSS